MNNPLTYAAIALVVIVFGLTCFYIAATVHSGNTDIVCIKHVVNQALGEAFRHESIKPPQTC